MRSARVPRAAARSARGRCALGDRDSSPEALVPTGASPARSNCAACSTRSRPPPSYVSASRQPLARCCATRPPLPCSPRLACRTIAGSAARPSIASHVASCRARLMTKTSIGSCRGSSDTQRDCAWIEDAPIEMFAELADVLGDDLGPVSRVDGGRKSRCCARASPRSGSAPICESAAIRCWFATHRSSACRSRRSSSCRW